MRKLQIILALINLLVFFPVFASPVPFECPQEIDCDDPVVSTFWGASCKPIGSDLIYQKYMLYSGGTGDTPIKGAYFFAGATIYGHGGDYKDIPYNVSCKYKLPVLEPDSPQNSFTISTKVSASLEPYTSRNHLWIQDNYEDGNYYAKCSSDLAAFCPISERGGIVFYNELITDYWNNEPRGSQRIRIKASFGTIDIKNDNSHGLAMFIPVDRVSNSGCGSQCIVKIQLGLQDGRGGWNYYDAGTIIVDVANQMKILSTNVNTNPMLPNKIKILQGPLNSIMFTTAY